MLMDFADRAPDLKRGSVAMGSQKLARPPAAPPEASRHMEMAFLRYLDDFQAASNTDDLCATALAVLAEL